MPPPPTRKPLHFIGSAQKDLREMPADVGDVFGAALLDVQYGEVPADAKPFGEQLPSDIWKLVEDHDGDTYRAAYTAAFPEAIYVLHVFKKKAKRGAATPGPDKDRVKKRFQAAEKHYREHYLNRSDR